MKKVLVATDLSARSDRALERAVVQAPFEGAAAQPAHDEVGRVGVAPVVDERDDVRVFQSGDEVRLGLETTDELGLGRELGADLLDRHLALHGRLLAAPHDREGAGADLLEQPVAA